ncbi:MAG: MoxR family ATPase [Actinobacteria bacterium]|nr:MoxR family ATPase [Actinomycetota bacterium]
MAKRATAQASAFQRRFDALVDNVSAVIRGKREPIELILVALLAQGHLLIEDVPGVGKTTLAKALARSISGTFQRIQFTPDLLPSDVTGVSVWNQAKASFEFRPGPVFANFTLADEINRASPRTQSALLEAMEERQVTVDGVTYELARPFMVVATQNPIEHEGTYSLPEAQLDRFLMRVAVGYPDRSTAIEILDEQLDRTLVDDLSPVISVRDLEKMTAATREVHVAASLQGYIMDLVDGTRSHPDLTLGVSPRGALSLQRAARALAGARGRDFVLPDDIKHLAHPVLTHRLLPTPEAQLRGMSPAEILDDVLDEVAVPRTRAPRRE